MYTFPPILIFTPDCVKLVFNYFLPDMYKLLYVDSYQVITGIFYLHLSPKNIKYETLHF